jgi:DNA repair protein RadD
LQEFVRLCNEDDEEEEGGEVISLRDYQQKVLDEIESSLTQFNRVLVTLATGGGKSRIFTYLAQEKAKESPVLIVVRGVHLVLQAGKNLDKFNIPYSVVMKDHWKFNPQEQIQILSIDTVFARKCFFFKDKRPFVIIDEGHQLNESSKKYGKFIEQYPDSKVVGMTGSSYPYSPYFEHVIEPIMPYELRDQGYLVPDVTYIPSTIDVSKVHIKKGEFNQKELAEASSTNTVIGDIVRCYKQYAEGRSTILFAVSIEHAKLICDKLNEAGIKSGQINSDETEEHNTTIITQFIKEEYQIIVNVNILSVGVDLPFVSCLILARPTLSTNLHVQQLGRGLRIHPGKNDCIILDLAGNSLRHGTAYSIREPFTKKAMAAKSMSISVCENCFRVLEKKGLCCYCAHVPSSNKKSRDIKYEDGELVKFEENPEYLQFIKECLRLEKVRKNKRIYTPSFVEQSMLKKFGIEVCRKYGDLINFPKHLLEEK